ncbi:MAG TPA: 2-dehydropantoate 2-reductase [Candidatus Limnocylindria bacterium]|nr:2-dehydropantoate 2-reductase [Candidatus Limnocylindria bacterium]
MRVLVVGAGGVGGYFGAKLARAGTSVTMLARGAHLEAIRRHGLRVRSAIEGEFVVNVEATDVVGSTPADAVLLCVKSFDTERAVEAIRPAVGPDTGVLSLQNGVDNEDTIDALLGAGHALGGAAYVFATIEAPGVIAHRFAGRIVFGEMDGRPRPRAHRLHDAFAAAGVPVELSDDVRRVLWEKYLLISAQAGMTSITRCPTGVLRATPESWTMYRRIVEELAAVARAAGVALGPDAVETVMAQAAAVGADTYSSLHHDLVGGRRLELETLHGHGVRLGARLGVDVPTVFAVYAALKPHVDGSRG